MFDIGGSELLLIGVVALVVIGPKELPGVLRTLGRTSSKLRQMAGEFRAQFDEAMREAELHDTKNEVGKALDATSTAMRAGFNPLAAIRDEIKGAVDRVRVDPAPPAPASVGETGPVVPPAPLAAIDLPPPPEPPPLDLSSIAVHPVDAPSAPLAIAPDVDAAAKPRARKRAAPRTNPDIVPVRKPRPVRREKTISGEPGA